MKSIVEEASTIFKAIEKGWIRAGKPKEFTVKVFEKPERNFFGLTTKSAKVGIIFDEKVASVEPVQQPKKIKPKEERKKHPVQKQLPKKQAPTQKQPLPKQRGWTDEMVAAAEQWVRDTLSIMGKQVAFNTTVNRRYLKFTFDAPVVEDNKKQKVLFSSMVHLLLESLRNKFKKDARNVKVILSTDK